VILIICDIASFTFCIERVALSIVANMCRKIHSEASDFVMETISTVIDLLNYQVVSYDAFCLCIPGTER
jgi:E3 ubiquitin-protein ligase TRIP12